MHGAFIYWVVVSAVGLPFVMIYLAYRRILFSKRVTVQQVMARRGVLQSYLKAFDRTAPDTTETQEKIVKLIFNLYYSTGSYLFGIAMNLMVSIAVTACIGVWVGLPLNLPTQLGLLAQKTSSTLAFSFAGAYIWNLYDLLKRYRSVDLTPAAFQFSWLRLLGACVAGPLISAGAASGLKDVIAFGVGVLPLQTIFEFFADAASKKMGTNSQRPAAGPTLHNLQGMTQDSLERMDEERIDSTATLAYTDPIKLFLKTDIEWVVVLDVIDQALLYGYIGDKLPVVRPCGIRGSIEAAIIYQRLQSGTPQEILEANAFIAILATKLDLSIPETLNLLRTVWEDCQVKLLWRLFGDAFSDDDFVKDSGGPPPTQSKAAAA